MCQRWVKSSIYKNPHQNLETLIGTNNGFILIQQSFFASFICGASNSEQLLNTELRHDRWNQVLTKTLTKIQKHWLELNNGCTPIQPSFFASFYMCCIKFWATFKHRIESRHVKSRIDESPHQNPEILIWVK